MLHMNTADEIDKLARLREQGVLSEAEFEQGKAALLAGDAPMKPVRSSRLAILALVLALLVFLPLVPLVGALLGIVAIVRLRARPHLGGRGAAIGAIVAGFVVTFMVQGILASVAIPAFIKYTRKAKTSEAVENLYRLRAGAKAYFHADHYGERGNLLPRRFPVSSGWTPASSCCAQGTTCSPEPAAWNRAPWTNLNFALTTPHYYQYRFASRGVNGDATATIEARSDLDCDGHYSSYKLLLMADEELGVTSRGPIIVDELE